MPNEPTVFVVDDDQAVRNVLHFTISAAGWPVELYGNAREFLEPYDPDRPGCLILDVRMPGMSGLDLQKELAARNILLPIIFLTGHGDVPMAVRALKKGAFGFLEKPFENKTLLEHIRKAVAADAQLRQDDERRREVAERLAQLKPGEQEVLDRVIAGQKNKQMAVELGTSISTIETRRRHIMEKLRVRNLSDLVRMVLYCRKTKGIPQNSGGRY